MIAFVTAGISTAAFLALWFWVVRRELQARTDTVKSAESQLAACRKKHMQARDGPEEQDARFILSRSLDIYHQSVMLYNQTLLKPQYRTPGFLMGFRPIKEGENA
jgi:hypothetical protein